MTKIHKKKKLFYAMVPQQFIEDYFFFNINSIVFLLYYKNNLVFIYLLRK
jgi:hypothetical protein